MFGKHLGRHDVANRPVVYVWQKAVCKTDAFFVVLNLRDEKTMKHLRSTGTRMPMKLSSGTPGVSLA